MQPSRVRRRSNCKSGALERRNSISLRHRGLDRLATGKTPQSDLTSNIEVYFPIAEVTATRDINRTREWIEGVGSGTWTDNVFNVTGSWNTEFSSGFTRSGNVTEALRREATCVHFVDGVVDITQNGNQGSLDYGDGTCDNVAVVTINGEEYTIQL